MDGGSSDHPIASAGRHEHPFAAKLIAFVDFAFGNALYFRHMHTVALVRIAPLLLFNLFCSLQQRCHLSIWLR